MPLPVVTDIVVQVDEIVAVAVPPPVPVQGVMLTVSPAAFVALAATEPPPVPANVIERLRVFAAAIRADERATVADRRRACGLTPSLDVSPSARARLSRPLPVSAAVPAASALRARRPTMTPFEAPGSTARSSAAAAATSAEEADVPVTDVVPPPAAGVTMSVPGAARNVSAP